MPTHSSISGLRAEGSHDWREQCDEWDPIAFTEIYFAGCNPSFVETSDGYVMINSPQQPIDAVRWRERMEEKAPIRYLINTEPHGDHIAGNAYFPKVKVVGQVKLKECFDRYLYAFGTMEEKRERMKETDPDSVWLVGHPDYPASQPAQAHLHRRADAHCRQSHLPHPPPSGPHRAADLDPRAGGGGRLHRRQHLPQMPHAGSRNATRGNGSTALDSIAALDVETIVPGHGDPCGKAYLKEQAQIVENWIGLVERFVDRGLSADDALKEPIEVTKQDPYPIGQRLFMHDERLTGMIVRNLHKRILERKQRARARWEGHEAAEIMTKEVLSVAPQTPLREVARLLARARDQRRSGGRPAGAPSAW